jgi:hypothetical protein
VKTPRHDNLASCRDREVRELDGVGGRLGVGERHSYGFIEVPRVLFEDYVKVLNHRQKQCRCD